MRMKHDEICSVKNSYYSKNLPSGIYAIRTLLRAYLEILTAICRRRHNTQHPSVCFTQDTTVYEYDCLRVSLAIVDACKAFWPRRCVC